jgi:hypothetical protein
MMNKNSQSDIGYPRCQGGLAQLYGIVLVAYTEGELKQRRTGVGQKGARSSVNSPGIAKDIYRKPQQKSQKYEQGLVGTKGVDQYKQYVNIRVDVSQKIDVI